MSCLLKILAILASLFVMAGCGAHNYTNMKYTDIAEYPNRYSAFDYKYAWRTTDTDNGILIEGLLKNVRYTYIDSVLMTVNILDKNGRIVAKAADFPMPQRSGDGDVSYFSLLLRDVKPAPGNILEFQVHYKGNEGGSGVDWHRSFKVDAMTGIAIRPPSKYKYLNNW